MSTERVEIDTREVASKLSFLVGQTILFRDGKEDACTATQVVAVKASNSPHPNVAIYTTVGIQNLDKFSKFRNIMLLNEEGGLDHFGKIADRLGICF